MDEPKTFKLNGEIRNLETIEKKLSLEKYAWRSSSKLLDWEHMSTMFICRFVAIRRRNCLACQAQNDNSA